VVCEDVDELAERVAHIETANAPRLVDRPVLDREARRAHARERCVEVVDLDREVGTLVPEPPSDATLICTLIFVAAP